MGFFQYDSKAIQPFFLGTDDFSFGLVTQDFGNSAFVHHAGGLYFHGGDIVDGGNNCVR